MIHKLLVAVDVSAAAMSALRTGDQIARQLGGQLVILHVIDVANCLRTTDGIHRFQPTLEQLRSQGQTLLETARSGVNDELEVTLLLREGDPADTIVNTAIAERADLVVIGTDSHGRLAHFLVGSTTDAVIRRSSCPVLAVRREQTQSQSLDDSRRQSAQVHQ